MIIPVIVLAVSAIFFAAGKTRSDVVALCALLVLVLTHTLSPQEALAGFSNPVVIMMAGLFVVGGGILQTGLAKTISGKIMKWAGNSQLALFLLVMTVTAAIGGFVSNTGTVALMLPIVVSIAAQARTNASTLLMPLAFASSMGGMLTLIGTPPNLVIQETLQEAGHEPLSFFSFLPVGLICIAVGIVVLLPLSRRFLNKKGEASEGRQGKSLQQLAAEYGLNKKLCRYVVAAGSGLAGRSVAELDIYNRYRLTIMERRQEDVLHGRIIRNISQTTVDADTVFQMGDVIYLSGSDADIRQFADDYKLDASADNEGGAQLEFYDIGIAELVLLPKSRLVGRLLRQTALRAKYRINVLAIRRKGEYIRERLADEKLTAGDVLLVQGS